MTIICGTDFSIHARNAADVAAALASRSRTTLRLMHGVQPAAVEFLPITTVDRLREQLRHKIVTEGNRLRSAGVEVMESVALGRPHEILANAAQSAKADLVVVSTIGSASPGRWLVGSVAEKTAQFATVPTLVVRNHEPLLAWAKRQRTLKVFVGCDFSASSEAALRWVASLLQIGDARITVAYVSWPPKETWRFGVGDCSPLSGSNLVVRTLLERDLKDRCAQAFGEVRPELRVITDWGPVDDKLIELAKAEAADLIVLGTSQRRGLGRFWLGSVSRGVLHNTSMNVACVPAMAEPNEAQKRIPTYRKVLVPTDFSKPGNRAIAFAYGAASRGGEVCLVHVISPTGGSKSRTEPANAPNAKRKRELTARLESLIPDDALNRGIRSKVEIVEHEHPAVAIGQAAERCGADLICIGSRGRSGIKKQLLGSVTEALMRRSPRPVLVVRE